MKTGTIFVVLFGLYIFIKCQQGCKQSALSMLEKLV
jgi:hypothetical protein